MSAPLASDMLADGRARAALGRVDAELRELEDTVRHFTAGGGVDVADTPELRGHARRLEAGVADLRVALEGGDL